MKMYFSYNDSPLALEVEADGAGWRVQLPDGSEHPMTVQRLPNDVLEITAGARTFRVPTARTGRSIELAYEGEAYTFTLESGKHRATGRLRQETSGVLTAPMGGVVADVMVTVGQRVEAYQPLAAVEAMKVYATIEAPTAGTVAAIHARKGERVTQGSPVLDVKPDDVKPDQDDAAGDPS